MSGKERKIERTRRKDLGACQLPGRRKSQPAGND